MGIPSPLGDWEDVNLANDTEEEALLDEAYVCSQNLTAFWVPLKDGKGCRSTSVGDVLVLYRSQNDAIVRQAYQVVSVGFKEVQFK